MQQAGVAQPDRVQTRGPPVATTDKRKLAMQGHGLKWDKDKHRKCVVCGTMTKTQ
jgi:hypothetical protein